MDRTIIAIIFTTCLFWVAQSANAAVIAFENFAPTGGLTEVTSTTPYSEAGFTLTPATTAFVVDSAFPLTMYGNVSDWYAIHPGVDSTLTSNSGPFDLLSVLVGPTTLTATIPMDMLIIGTLTDGTQVSTNVTNLLSATITDLGWTGLSSVTFSSLFETGIDDIRVRVPVTAPEPNILLLSGLGLILLGISRRPMRLLARTVF